MLFATSSSSSLSLLEVSSEGPVQAEPCGNTQTHLQVDAMVKAVNALNDGRGFPVLAGDAGSNPGMRSLCKTAADAYPGLYVVCANVANGLASITMPLAEPVGLV